MSLARGVNSENKFFQNAAFKIGANRSHRLHRIRIRTVAYTFEKVGECLLYPCRIGSRPKAIVKFLGGAFIGASPDITYRYFIELLAKEGFLVVTAPYNVTFDHEICAQEIHRKWCNTLECIASSGCPSMGLTSREASLLPRISIGHSNGALMQALICSRCDEANLPKANVVISFNNKPASEAVPFLDQVGPLTSQLKTFTPIPDVAKFLANETAKTIENISFPLPLGVGDEYLNSLKRFVQQIPPVFGQVADGVSEFRPTPERNRETISSSYLVPHNLLVKFTVDGIDETDVLEGLLKPQVEIMNGTLTKIVLNGTHLTPLAQDIKLEVGTAYTPIDALNQAARSAALADIKNLAQKIGSWFDSLSL